MSKMNFAMLLVGAGIGSAVTWFCVKKKYEQIAQDEINSVKEVYHKRYNESTDKENKNDTLSQEVNSDEKSEYEEKIAELGYDSDEIIDDNDSKNNKPYIIDIDEFGENENYDTATLYYYGDGVLADADDEIIEDINKTVGDEALLQLDEEDCVYVRNDRLEIEYEIVKDLRTYDEATMIIPHPRED